MVKIVVFDLDLTLWDHADVSAMKPPFRRLDENTIIDSENDRLRLYPCVRNLLKKLKDNGYKLSIASWNITSTALKALETLKLIDFFDYIVIEPHPEKEKMIEKILNFFRDEGEVEEIYFVDDNFEMIRRVRERYPFIKCILVGSDIETVCDLDIA